MARWPVLQRTHTFIPNGSFKSPINLNKQVFGLRVETWVSGWSPFRHREDIQTQYSKAPNVGLSWFEAMGLVTKSSCHHCCAQCSQLLKASNLHFGVGTSLSWVASQYSIFMNLFFNSHCDSFLMFDAADMDRFHMILSHLAPLSQRTHLCTPLLFVGLACFRAPAKLQPKTCLLRTNFCGWCWLCLWVLPKLSWLCHQPRSSWSTWPSNPPKSWIILVTFTCESCKCQVFKKAFRLWYLCG